MYELPAGGQATPMTYSVDGKQYVVIAAGGHGKLGTKQATTFWRLACREAREASFCGTRPGG